MKKTREEVEHLISIGFCQPKFYKRNVWQKAKRIMDTLCEHTNYVIPYNYGRGKGKYRTVHNDITNEMLALEYITIKGWKIEH